jgi:CRISPR-associated endonuclease/helicase Cas3
MNMNRMMSDETLVAFWAKTPRSEEDRRKHPNSYHPLICHLLDVAAVTQLMWAEVLSNAAKRRIAQAFNQQTNEAGLALTGKLISWIAGLHDLGKASPPFTWRADNKETKGLMCLYTQPPFQYDKNAPPPAANTAPHGYVTAVTLPLVLQDCDASEALANQIGEIIGGHHGIFATTNDLNKLRRSLKKNGIYVGARHWQTARQELAIYLADLLEFDLGCLNSLPSQRFDNAVVMIMAGLVSVADWIGSNTKYFRLKVKNVATADLTRFDGAGYLRHAKKKARKALRESGWLDWPHQRVAKGFFELFPALEEFGEPLPAQQAILDLPKSMPLDKPGLVIIEEQMGAGKTEAAIALADRWNVELGQRGIYFALPTMATSNQMFGRVCEYLTVRFPNVDVPVYLLHGHASLISDFKDIRDNKARATEIHDISCDGVQGHQECPGNLVAASWFTYRKKGLLPPFGVGTVDQALMAALRTSHAFVRLFGLAHKTIIIDEVHAYDTYMTKLIERLLEWLGALKSPVILLSATLPSDKRRALINAYAQGLSGERKRDDKLPASDYPRITWTTGDKPQAKSLQPKDAKRRELLIEWVDGRIEEQADSCRLIGNLGEKLRDQLKNGGCAAVICNTVGRAQQMFRALSAFFDPETELDLFHARFLFEDRERQEKLALWRFGKAKKKVDFGNGDIREVDRPKSKFVLVATQVIEQSLDLDFDLMVSDFAPTDLWLQRSGRIWRHDGNPRYGIAQPTLWLCQPEISESELHFDSGTEAVYQPGWILLRSWLALNQQQWQLVAHQRTVKIPGEIEPLIDATYPREGADDCPAHFTPQQCSFWQTLRLKHNDLQKQHNDFAEEKLLRDPQNTEHLGEFFRRELEEDLETKHATHRALTRLGDSISVVCFDESTPFDEKVVPDPDETEQLLKRSVTISRQGLVQQLRALPLPSGWKKAPLLRHYRRVVLNQETEGLDYVFKLDKRLGVLIEKRGGKQ